MKEKSPAYQQYPKDFLTDKRVIRMSLEREAIYRRLLDYCWLENGLDNDMELLASYSKMPGDVERFKEHWKEIKNCFYRDGKKWRNPRQEKERKKQKKFSEKQRKAAQTRWDKVVKPDATADATASLRHESSNALHLQSSSAFPSSNKDRSKSDILNFSEEQMRTLKTEIAKVMEHSLFSPANEESTTYVLKRVKKYMRKHKVDDPFAYALTTARGLRTGFKKQGSGV